MQRKVFLAIAAFAYVKAGWLSPALAQDGRTELTAYPDFQNACTAFVVGYAKRPGSGDKMMPVRGDFAGSCPAQAKPLLFAVTHESEKNNHVGAKNYAPDIASYMADYGGPTPGPWLTLKLTTGDPPTAMIGIDTIAHGDTDETGWSVRYGHLFASMADLSAQAKFDSDVVATFDLRVTRSTNGGADLAPFSGHRVMLGLELDWPEAPPRTNRTHYLEIDLEQTPGYAQSYKDPVREGCSAGHFDRCFYDPQGRFAEGRYLDVKAIGLNAEVTPTSGGWSHVVLHLAQIGRSIGWVSPPSSWARARMGGLYLGVEGEGATAVTADIRHYNLYADK